MTLPQPFVRGNPILGPLWTTMHARPRVPMALLKASDLPDDAPGVYTLYRDGDPMYVGLAKDQSLRGRFWGSHRGRGVSMTSSALRRNVAEYLGIARATAIKKREYQPTPEDARRVVEWLDGCDVAWIECPSPEQAADLERDMKTVEFPRFDGHLMAGFAQPERMSVDAEDPAVFGGVPS